MPKIARTDRPFALSKDSGNLTALEKSLIEDFRSREGSPRDAWFGPEAARNPMTSGWWLYAQHQEVHTRLLDITRNPLVALFFATESNGKDGLVLRMNTAGSTDASGEPRPLASATYEECFDWNTPLPDGDNPWSTFDVKYPNDRLLAQSGGFAWSPNLLPNVAPSGGAIKICIPGVAKQSIRLELSALGITEEQLFPPKPDFVYSESSEMPYRRGAR